MADPIILKFQAEGLNELSQGLVAASKNTDTFGKEVDDAKLGINEMTAAIQKSKEALVGLKPGTDEFNKLSKEIQAAEIFAKGFTSSTGTMRQELRTTIEAVQNMSVQLDDMRRKGLEGTAAYKALNKEFVDAKNKAGQLKDRIGDLNKETAQLGSDTKGIDRFIRTLNVGVSAVTGLQAATVLFGKENKNLEKTLVQLNAAMLLSNSIQQISNELLKEDSVFKGVSTAATKLWTYATNGATAAMSALRIALVALGIGAVIALIYGAIKAYEFFTKATNDLIKSTKTLKEIQDAKNKALELEIKYKQALGQLDDRGGLQQELINANVQLAESKKNLDAINQEISRLEGKDFGLLDKILGVTTGVSTEDVNKDKLAALKKSQQEAITLNKENTIAVKSAADALAGYEKKQITTGKEIKKTTEELEKFNDGLNQGGKDRETFLRSLGLDQEGGKLVRSRLDSILNQITAAAAERVRIELTAQQRIAQGERDLADQTGKAASDAAKAQEAATNEREQKAADAFGTANQFINAISQKNAIQAEKEIKLLEDKKRRGIISEKEFQKQLAAIKNEQAKKDKRAAVIQALIAIPQAILAQLAKGNLIGAAIAGALAAVQAAIIIASPVPTFAKGGETTAVKNFKGSGLVRGRSHKQGGVNAELEGNEFVHKVDAVKHYGVQFMKDVNNLKFPKAMTVSMKNKPVYNSTTTVNNGNQELQYIGNYIKQGNEHTLKSTKLLQRIAKNTVNKSGYA